MLKLLQENMYLFNKFHKTLNKSSIMPNLHKLQKWVSKYDLYVIRSTDDNYLLLHPDGVNSHTLKKGLEGANVWHEAAGLAFIRASGRVNLELYPAEMYIPDNTKQLIFNPAN